MTAPTLTPERRAELRKLARKGARAFADHVGVAPCAMLSLLDALDAAEARAKAAEGEAKVLAAYLTGAVGLMEAVCRASGADDMALTPDGSITLSSAKTTLAAYRKERPADAD